MEPFFPLSALCYLRNTTWLDYSVFGSFFTATLELDASAWICSIKQRAAFAIDGIASTGIHRASLNKRACDYYSG